MSNTREPDMLFNSIQDASMRVRYLEKTMEDIKKSHSATIYNLHQEIARLASICSDMMMQMSIEGPIDDRIKSKSRTQNNINENAANAPNEGINSEVSIMPAAKIETIWNEEKEYRKSLNREKTNSLVTASINHCPDGNISLPNGDDAQIKNDDVAIKELESNQQEIGGIVENYPSNTETPLYLMVQKEKRKYLTLVEKYAQEKKRKQVEVNSLRGEIEAYKTLLAMAGVPSGIKEVKAALQAGKDLNKAKALPPISSKTESRPSSESGNSRSSTPSGSEGGDAIHEYNENSPIFICKEIGSDELYSNETLASPEPELDVLSDTTANKDIDEQKKKIDRIRSARYKIAADSTVDFSRSNSLRSLPPLEKGLGSVLVKAKEKFKNAKTAYSDRIQRAKLIRDKQLKELQQ